MYELSDRGGMGARGAGFPRNIAPLRTFWDDAACVFNNASTWTSQKKIVKKISTNLSQQFALRPLTIFVKILMSVGKFVECNPWGDGSSVALVT